MCGTEASGGDSMPSPRVNEDRPTEATALELGVFGNGMSVSLPQISRSIPVSYLYSRQR
jgi:hypothetical protein